MNTVTKADLVKTIAAEFGYSKTEARASVDAFFEALTEAIVEGHRIEARGFGAFTVKHSNAKAGARNPKTGERVYVPARRKVAFKPGRILREALSQPAEQADVSNENTASEQTPAASNGAASREHENGSVNGESRSNGAGHNHVSTANQNGQNHTEQTTHASNI